MPFFTSASQRRREEYLIPNDDIDDFLTSELESSFASNVSLSSPSAVLKVLASDADDLQPMDISPLPIEARSNHLISGRPRASTTAARMFGGDVSNRRADIHDGALLAGKPTPSLSSGKRMHRSALPLEWMSSTHTAMHETQDSSLSQGDAMDVDISFNADTAPLQAFSAEPQSAAPTITNFNHLFYNALSPHRPPELSEEPQVKKRRSHSPDAISHEFPSSSPAQSSPSQRKLERITSVPKPFLQGLGAPPPSGSKRARRPALSAMVTPSDAAVVQSAYPILAPPEKEQPSDNVSTLPPTRRAFSALIAPSSLTEQLSEDSSFEVDASSPAQAYAKRQQMKTIRRCDGTDDFRPLTGATAMVMKESPSPSQIRGMPGFGDNEAMGKILPCHRVPDDGLMRITPNTLTRLLDGEFDSKIHDYRIVDCRFDYEYNGGHILGAVNINTTAQVESLLLGPSLLKPKPCVSGDAAKKIVLIFHCEFSAKRAPTFAKHLRHKDRASNNHIYPKIHYPELYILEGGYCNFFKRSPAHCEPSGYVTMDDPTYATSRREDLDQFRKTKFGRHRSYTYGDGGLKTNTIIVQQQKRNTAPSGGPTSTFATANVARSRRSGSTLCALVEDFGSPQAGDTDVDDSPCPPPVKSKKGARGSIARAETYGPSRINSGL